MRQALRIHPDSRCTAATHIEVEVARPRAENVVVHYFVTGRLGDLRMPPLVDTTRTDGLWRHTCFEAFVCASRSIGYYEFNFAPSKQWAAYQFASYRRGMSVASAIGTPDLQVRSDGTCYELRASLELGGLPDLSTDVQWYLAISAVIEETSGRKSYWALAHPPGKADFHHSDSFALELLPV